LEEREILQLQRGEVCHLNFMAERGRVREKAIRGIDFAHWVARFLSREISGSEILLKPYSGSYEGYCNDRIE
jgi:hypothetical protein